MGQEQLLNNKQLLSNNNNKEVPNRYKEPYRELSEPGESQQIHHPHQLLEYLLTHDFEVFQKKNYCTKFEMLFIQEHIFIYHKLFCDTLIVNFTLKYF